MKSSTRSVYIWRTVDLVLYLTSKKPHLGREAKFTADSDVIFPKYIPLVWGKLAAWKYVCMIFYLRGGSKRGKGLLVNFRCSQTSQLDPLFIIILIHNNYICIQYNIYTSRFVVFRYIFANNANRWFVQFWCRCWCLSWVTWPSNWAPSPAMTRPSSLITGKKIIFIYVCILYIVYIE